VKAIDINSTSKAVTAEKAITSSKISGGVKISQEKICYLKVKRIMLSVTPEMQAVVKNREASMLAFL